MINVSDVTATATTCIVFNFIASPQAAFGKGTHGPPHTCMHRG
jgi:hypothetical protein